MSESNVLQLNLPACPYCGGQSHCNTLCPRIKKIHYYENGVQKEVELFDARRVPHVFREFKNTTKFHPAGHHCLVAPKEASEQASPDSPIVKPRDVMDREELSECDGVLVACGRSAWIDLPLPYAQPGQRVVFSKYAGIMREHGGKKYRLIEDIEIVATLGDEVP